MNREQVKARIIEIIESEDSYITADQIYHLLNNVHPGRTQETIRKYIRELVNEEKNLIGSSNRGYFKINTQQKAHDAISYLLSRVPDLEMRANNLRDAWNEQNPNNQLNG